MTYKPQGAEELRAALQSGALPVLYGWFWRLRRDRRNADGALVATHLALVVGGLAAEGRMQAAPPEAQEQAVLTLLSCRCRL